MLRHERQPEPRRATGARTLIVVATAAAMLSLGTQQAMARRGYDTFRGSCQIPATVTFDPPLSGSTQETHATADGKGPCTGTWITASGRRLKLNGAAVVYHAEADGQQSCARSEGSSGPGYFRYGRHTISFTFSESRVGVYTPITLKGKRGGVFEGRADPATDENPVEILEKCASTGLDRADVVINGSTAPKISG